MPAAPLPVVLTLAPLDISVLSFPTDTMHRWDIDTDGPVPDDLWQQVEVLYTLQAFPTVQQAPHLRWIQLHSAGSNQATNHSIGQTDVIITNASGVHAIPMAEYVIAVMLSLQHRVPQMVDYQRRAEWPDWPTSLRTFNPQEAWGQTIGIVGYGSIGRQVARLATGLGMRVLAMQYGSQRRDEGFVLPGTGDPDGSLPSAYVSPADLHQLLAESDVVVLALPLTPATTRLIDAAALAAMRPHAILINVGRGATVDEDALVAALGEGRIGGAGLDVYVQEPLPASSPLWHAPNTLLSPHISGTHPLYAHRVGLLFDENMRRYRSGLPLLNVVDRARGY